MVFSPISARQHVLTVAKIINKIALHWSKSGVPAASLDVEEEENGEGGTLLVLVEELNVAGAGITDKTNNIELVNSRIFFK